jgi:hypothetical protein
MVYDGFCCYFFSTCQLDYQGDLVVYFTMFLPHHATTANLWHCKIVCLFQEHGLFVRELFQFYPQLFFILF